MNRTSPRPTLIPGRRPIHRPGRGVKRLPPARRRNKRWKIKRQLLPSKNIDVKHRGNIVRNMTVRRRAIFPSLVGGVY